MKNSDFFNILSSVKADCRFNDLPSSYFWNTRKMWNFYFRVDDTGFDVYFLKVYYSFHGDWTEVFTVQVSVLHGIVNVLDICYPPHVLTSFSPDVLKKSLSFLLGKYRNYSLFLDKFSLAAKVFDEEFISCV